MGKYHTIHYWLNKDNKIEGEYKSWYESGQLFTHCFFKNGLIYGEHKSWRDNGQLVGHYFFHIYEIDITKYVEDINNITEQEYFYLQLVFGCFPVLKYDGTL